MHRLLMIFLLTMVISGEALASEAPVHNWITGMGGPAAMRIAKDEIDKTTFPKYFRKLEPMVRSDQYAQKYADHWFVEFRSQPILNMPSVLVVVEKKSGKVILVKDEYWPDAQPELDWVFN
ncbi:MAG: hypothetical protein KC684_02700 [Candidatus Omnitrophica bacterium]|nr:hypothetical protein [Candidatus Omnitrophota bacterium]